MITASTKRNDNDNEIDTGSTTDMTNQHNDDDDNHHHSRRPSASPPPSPKQPPPPPPPRPRPIQILASDVMEHIAAGEIVQRTSLAVKELLENSVDAQATLIKVSLSFRRPHHTTNNNNNSGGGGCFSLTVTDNGTGIPASDLPLACTRHATSKITSYTDLTRTTTTSGSSTTSHMTFGFRGEALAALSMVARNITITSRTAAATNSTTESSSSNHNHHSNGNNLAYQMQYKNGQPIVPASTSTSASSIPRMMMTRVPRSTIGTTIHVPDLFHDAPARQVPANREHAEYHTILKLLQYYAIHTAARGIRILCERHLPNNTVVTDLNTTPFVPSSSMSLTSNTNTTLSLSNPQLPQQTTRNVIGHTMGSHILPYLLYHSSELYTKCSNDHHANTNATESQQWIYTCTGNITSPQYYYDSNKSIKPIKPVPMILFINHRYIEGGTSIRKSIEDLYATMFSHRSTTNNKKKLSKPPFIYLSLHVPNDTIDVNVHPTKRDVILLHVDQILHHLVAQMRRTLEQHAAATARDDDDEKSPTDHRTRATTMAISNPTKENDPHQSSTTVRVPIKTTQTVASIINPYSQPPLKRYKTASDDNDDDDDDDSYINNDSNVDTLSATTCPTSHRNDRNGPSELDALLSQPKIQPKSYIRTTRMTQSGSLEKYFAPVDKRTSNHPTPPDHDSAAVTIPVPCPLHHTDQSAAASIMMMIPGAFAKVASQCTCSVQRLKLDLSQPPPPHVYDAIEQKQQQQQQTLPSTAAATTTTKWKLRLQRKPPTLCDYTSIQQLRKRTIQKCRHEAFETTKLRNAVYVGTLSQYRSILQCQDELFVMNHYECARELFYQLALNQFGRIPIGSLASGGAIDIERIIGQYVQLEEVLQQHRSVKNFDDESTCSMLQVPLQVTDTNLALAQQAAACLVQHAEMLYDYYSIRIDTTGRDGRATLTGLPVLIDGYEPSPHGLPLFLLRLASEVDWSQEKPCFYGICRELGSYYAQIPSNLSDDEHKAMIQHVFFPAITTLLVPSKEMATTEFVTITSLPKLYKIFERC